MSRQKPDSQPPPKRTRGKYARAFEKGINVVIRDSDRDRRFLVRKKPDGGFSWTPQPATVTKRRKAS